MTIPFLTGLLLLSGCNQNDEQTTDTQPDENETNYVQTDQNSDSSDPNQKQENKDEEENERDTDQDENTNQNDEDKKNSDQTDDSTQASEPLDKERAKVVLKEYEKVFQDVINNTNKELKQQEFTEKQQLQEHFQNFMSEDLALTLMEAFIREEEDGLYIVATEAPLFLKEEEPFTFTKNDEKSATVTQERENPMIGHIEMQYTITKNEGSWVVKSISSDQL